MESSQLKHGEVIDKILPMETQSLDIPKLDRGTIKHGPNTDSQCYASLM